MIYLQIDKASFSKEDLINYLEEVKEEIKKGRELGEDWEIKGEEESIPDPLLF